MNPKIKPENIVVSFVGTADEALLNFILRRVEQSSIVGKKTKSRLCISAIELINNVITHGNRSSFCLFHIEKTGKSFDVICGNFITEKKFDYIKKRIKEASKQKDLENFYYGLLRNSSPGTSGKLGLVRMYKISEGNFEVKKENFNGKTFGKISLKIKNYA